MSVRSTTHECPAPGCTAQVARDKLACVRHWYSIPQRLRGELWRAYRSTGIGSSAHVAAVRACVDYLNSAAGS